MNTTAMPSEISVTWRKTITHGFLSSRHFWLVIMFNLLNYIDLLGLYRRFHEDARFAPYLTGFILLIVFLINYAGYYILNLYRLMKREFAKSDFQEESATSLLQISYVAFRLYILCLGMSFVFLASFLYAMK
ncbi:MAG: hypothetical protein ABI286_10935 [Edaphobacter sp.]